MKRRGFLGLLGIGAASTVVATTPEPVYKHKSVGVEFKKNDAGNWDAQMKGEGQPIAYDSDYEWLYGSTYRVSAQWYRNNISVTGMGERLHKSQGRKLVIKKVYTQSDFLEITYIGKTHSQFPESAQKAIAELVNKEYSVYEL